MLSGKKFVVFLIITVQVSCIFGMEPVKRKKWYEYIDFLVDLFGQQNIQGRQRQMHRDSSEKTVPKIDQMAHAALFGAICKNDSDGVKVICNENNVIDINYRETQTTDTLLIAALKNFEKQKKNKNSSEIRKAKAIIGIICDPSRSVSMDMELLRDAQKIAEKYSKKYKAPELNRALGLIVVNKEGARIIGENDKKMGDPDELKQFQKLTGIREDSFFLAAQSQSKNTQTDKLNSSKSESEGDESKKALKQNLP